MKLTGKEEVRSERKGERRKKNKTTHEKKRVEKIRERIPTERRPPGVSFQIYDFKRKKKKRKGEYISVSLFSTSFFIRSSFSLSLDDNAEEALARTPDKGRSEVVKYVVGPGTTRKRARSWATLRTRFKPKWALIKWGLPDGASYFFGTPNPPFF